VNMYAKILNKNIRKQYPITYENNYAQWPSRNIPGMQVWVNTEKSIHAIHHID
jgi:hypothetical protein